MSYRIDAKDMVEGRDYFYVLDSNCRLNRAFRITMLNLRNSETHLRIAEVRPNGTLESDFLYGKAQFRENFVTKMAESNPEFIELARVLSFCKQVEDFPHTLNELLVALEV